MADTVTFNAYRIELLAGASNYSSWKIQMEDILTEQNCSDHIDAKFVVPADSDKKTAWDKADRRALSSIRLRVGSDVVQHIQGETTALGAWQMLSQLFELKGKMGLVLARHKFYSARALEDVALEPHIKMMRQLQGELTSLGRAISDSDFAVALLSSLPKAWDSFVRATLNESTTPTSLSVIASILTEERRRNDQEGEINIADRAMISHHRRIPTRQSNVAVPNAPSAFSTPNWKNAICHKCGGKGHIARVCPSQSDAPNPDQANFAFGAYDQYDDEELSDFAF